MEPLRALTRQGTKWRWGKEENGAFEALKDQLAEASMMAFYKEAPTEVVTDASPVGLGAIFVQEKQGLKRAVAFASRSLSDVERRYSQTEKEAQAVVWACERFHLYLSGLQSFQLVTNCKALQAIYSPRSKPSARVERWVLCLMPFKYTVRHVPSGQNIADCLHVQKEYAVDCWRREFIGLTNDQRVVFGIFGCYQNQSASTTQIHLVCH